MDFILSYFNQIWGIGVALWGVYVIYKRDISVGAIGMNGRTETLFRIKGLFAVIIGLVVIIFGLSIAIYLPNFI